MLLDELEARITQGLDGVSSPDLTQDLAVFARYHEKVEDVRTQMVRRQSAVCLCSPIGSFNRSPTVDKLSDSFRC
jgi:hypothetical protein